MARKIIWSNKAQTDRKEILDYWWKRNQSNSYSKKLNLLFKKAIRLTAEHPNIGRQTDLGENIRIKIIRDYLIIYEVSETRIIVLTIWDARQDPERLLNIFGK